MDDETRQLIDRLKGSDPADPLGQELVRDFVRIGADHVRNNRDLHKALLAKDWGQLTPNERDHLHFLASNFVDAALYGMV